MSTEWQPSDYTHRCLIIETLSTPGTLRPSVLSQRNFQASPPLALRFWNWCERIIALAIFVLALPLLVLVGLVITVLARRSPILTHTRVGQFGNSFEMLKFRTMWGDRVDHEPWNGIKPFEDPRIRSRFARFCRRYSIDEAPQLLHVMSGKMALVGPRPLTRDELERHYCDATVELLTVRPGLTGLWQVMGRSRLTYPQRRRLDLFLVRHQLVRFYAGILLRTIPQVITGKNAW